MDSKKQRIADALIPDRSGRIFVQRRALTRRLFPGCWDLVGGHVESNEDVVSALTREIREETGWTLRTIRHEISIKAWRDGPNEYEERQFIVDVQYRDAQGKPRAGRSVDLRLSPRSVGCFGKAEAGVS
jgi:8-oxo-dGTP pyrophosphatase MutT (NUDIX family)